LPSLGSGVSNLTPQQYRQAYIYDIGDRLGIFEEVEGDSQNMQMFQKDPIVAHFSKNKEQKFTIEEIFRSQIKLISDTIAKEFLFILEFFDFKISNKT
jgi:hypothetical protein